MYISNKGTSNKAVLILISSTYFQCETALE